MTPLQIAAKCAMADMIGAYHIIATQVWDTAGMQTIVDLYTALQGEGIDVSDYEEQVGGIQESLAELEV